MADGARGDAAVGITMEAHTSLGASPFYLFGGEEQKERFLVPLARGEQLWAFGLTEPEAGSDANGTRTHAVLRGGCWHIDGEKCLITNAGTQMSGGVTITAVTGKQNGQHHEISNLIVPTGTPGYQIGPLYQIQTRGHGDLAMDGLHILAVTLTDRLNTSR